MVKAGVGQATFSLPEFAAGMAPPLPGLGGGARPLEAGSRVLLLPHLSLFVLLHM